MWRLDDAGGHGWDAASHRHVGFAACRRRRQRLARGFHVTQETRWAFEQVHVPNSGETPWGAPSALIHRRSAWRAAPNGSGRSGGAGGASQTGRLVSVADTANAPVGVAR